MGIFDPVRTRLEARKRKRTEDAIHDALDRAYKEAKPRTANVGDGEERIVIFSDHHKGARDGADDFQRSERTYNAALAYYDKLGYHLIELGDVEELWENSFEEVVGKYEATLKLAAAFHAAGRYTRVWGNHDLAWNDREFFQERMRPYGYGDVEPIEALRLTVEETPGTPVVELFLVHGHQGTADSDRRATLSRFLVRRGWRPLQRLLDRPWNTPSVDWGLRGEHAGQMAGWASKEGHVLIAGHTHKPVFFQSAKSPEVTPDQVTAPADVSDPLEAEALELARLEWAKAELARLELQPPMALEKPWYFNTGCCSFGDGDITGIEISGGEIRLIRWPCTAQTAPEQLDHLPLASLPTSAT